MSVDLIKRLRADAAAHVESYEVDGSGSPITASYLCEAADEIERLRADAMRYRKLRRAHKIMRSSFETAEAMDAYVDSTDAT